MSAASQEWAARPRPRLDALIALYHTASTSTNKRPFAALISNPASAASSAFLLSHDEVLASKVRALARAEKVEIIEKIKKN